MLGTLTILSVLGIVDYLTEEVSPFGIQCCLVTPGYYRTEIFAPTNIKFRPASIHDYAEFNKLYQGGVAALHHNQAGDPRKATDRIVAAVRSEGKAAGKRLPSRLPIGPDGASAMRDKCLKTMKLCDEWEGLSDDTNLDSKQ